MSVTSKGVCCFPVFRKLMKVFILQSLDNFKKVDWVEVILMLILIY